MAQKTCPNCGTQQPENYLFCAECGSKLPETAPDSVEKTSTPEPVKAPEKAPRPARPDPGPAKGSSWTLIHLSRAGGTNVPYPVPAAGFNLGTSGCAVNVSDDNTMSPRHLFVVPTDGGLSVEDAGSVNGLFLKIRTPHSLTDDDIFVCGDSVFRFTNVNENITPEDFKLYASANEPCPAGTVTKILAGGVDGPVYPVLKHAIVIGRDSADISCPEDRYMSRVHATVESSDNGNITLTDKQSRNGTYVKTSGSIIVRNGDVILIGRQLLKVEAR